MGPGKETRQLRDKLKNNRKRETARVVPIKRPPKKRRFRLRSLDAPVFIESPIETEEPTEAQPTKEKQSRIKNVIDFDAFKAVNAGEVHDKPQDKRRNNMVLRVIIFFVFLVAIVLLFYVITPLSNLSTVSITGNTQLDYRAVYQLSDISIGDKMYFIQPEQVSATLEDTPLIDEAIVTKEGFGTIRIHIQEERTVGYIPADDGFYPVQESGYMIPEAVQSPTLGPLLYHFDENNIAAMLASLGALNEDVVASISEIYARPTSDNHARIQLYMNDGQVIIADIDTFSDKFSYYTNMRSEIEDSSVGIIDIEVGNSFLPYTSNEARELMASIYGESISQVDREAREEIVEPLKAVFEGFSVQ